MILTELYVLFHLKSQCVAVIFTCGFNTLWTLLRKRVLIKEGMTALNDGCSVLVKKD